MTLEHPTLETLPDILNNPIMLMSQLRRFVGQCIRVVEEGGEPQLEGLDEQVKLLCRHLAEMESAEAQAMRPKMESLVAELDQLAEGIRGQRQEVLDQLNDLTLQRRALGAYARADRSAPQPQENEG